MIIIFLHRRYQNKAFCCIEVRTATERVESGCKSWCTNIIVCCDTIIVCLCFSKKLCLRCGSKSVTHNNICLFSLISAIDVKLTFFCFSHSKTHKRTMPILKKYGRMLCLYFEYTNYTFEWGLLTIRSVNQTEVK